MVKCIKLFLKKLKGQKISQKDAKELNLAEKPELAKAEKGE